jgi:hypothetical protein
MILTVSQAARAAGKSKGQISRMIRSGKISADRSNSSRPLIDGAELLRVYPHADLGKRHLETSPETHAQPEETGAMQAQIDALMSERDRLRADLDREREAAAERETWLRQQVETAQRQLADQRPREDKRGWLGRLLGS